MPPAPTNWLRLQHITALIPTGPHRSNWCWRRTRIIAILGGGDVVLMASRRGTLGGGAGGA